MHNDRTPRRLLVLAGISLLSFGPAFAGPAPEAKPAASVSGYSAPGEFEPQEYIWLNWNEAGFLGGPTFSEPLVNIMKALTPHVKVRLMYSEWPGAVERALEQVAPRTPAEAEARLRERLRRDGVDLARVELFYWPRPFGSIQDPGPYFLRNAQGGLAIADYGFDHPDPTVVNMDRDIAAKLGLPTVSSTLKSEGGARQTNGAGVLLLVEAVERDRNPKLSLEEIEREHLRVMGAKKVIWLKHGAQEEELWGKLPDGRYAIGTGGHVDEVARFVDPHTILLAEVSPADRDASPISRETDRRMSENFEILSHATDASGQPFHILRVTLPDLMTAHRKYEELKGSERYWFPGAKPGEEIEFYLPGSYLNFIMANGVVVIPGFWHPGDAETQRLKDEHAKTVFQAAFPNRQIVQVYARAMLFDGAGLHCWSRNQPSSVIAAE